jgi:hypothetical protein
VAEQTAPRYRSAAHGSEAAGGWVVGFVVFAAVLMVMGGVAAHGRDVRAWPS